MDKAQDVHMFDINQRKKQFCFNMFIINIHLVSNARLLHTDLRVTETAFINYEFLKFINSQTPLLMHCLFNAKQRRLSDIMC